MCQMMHFTKHHKMTKSMSQFDISTNPPPLGPPRRSRAAAPVQWQWRGRQGRPVRAPWGFCDEDRIEKVRKIQVGTNNSKCVKPSKLGTSWGYVSGNAFVFFQPPIRNSWGPRSGWIPLGHPESCPARQGSLRSSSKMAFKKQSSIKMYIFATS